MRCRHCGFTNGQDDHRCLRCGRRLAGTVVSAPQGYSGANALALNPALVTQETLELSTLDFPTANPAAPQTGQTSLFNATQSPLDTFTSAETMDIVPPQSGVRQNVIPFNQIPRPAIVRPAAPQPAPRAQQRPTQPPAQASPVQTQQVKKPAAPQIEQGVLDFIPSAPAHRALDSNAPAQIDCELPVARPRHRLSAGCFDLMIIALAFGIFLGVVRALGASLGEGRQLLITMGASVGLISLFYGLIWVWAGTETAGMRLAGLRLTTFEGHPVDSAQRFARFAGTLVSFCSLGVGIIWALADEEHLAWNDHISKTFPTPVEAPQSTLSRNR